jgi:hypothetical protein
MSDDVRWSIRDDGSTPTRLGLAVEVIGRHHLYGQRADYHLAQIPATDVEGRRNDN